MVDNGIIGSTADLVVSATNGELNINAAINAAAYVVSHAFKSSIIENTII